MPKRAPRPQAPRIAAAALSAARKRNAPSSLSLTIGPRDVNFKGHCSRHSACTHVSPAHRSAATPPSPPAASRSRAPSSISDSFAHPAPPPPGSVSVGSVKRRATQASRPSPRTLRKRQTTARASSGNSSPPSGSGAAAGAASSSSSAAVGSSSAAVWSTSSASRLHRGQRQRPTSPGTRAP
jgi:hypothetical protein